MVTNDTLYYLMDSFDKTLWCGFYLTDDSGEVLYLGPYQGPIACTTILFGKGVCGNAAYKQCSELVPNVHLYPGHIACSSSTNSEVVVPLLCNNTCVGVLDLDSDNFQNFTQIHLVSEDTVWY